MASMLSAPVRRTSWPFMSACAEHMPQLSAFGMPVPSRQEVEFRDGQRIWLRRVQVGSHPSEWLRDLGAPAEGVRVDLVRCIDEAQAVYLFEPGTSARDVATWISNQLRARFATRDAFVEFAVTAADRGETRTVTIPAREEHEGCYAITVALPWRCIHCGGPRGEPDAGISYDGSRRLAVSTWLNPCGHVEKYSEVRAWLAQNQPRALEDAAP